MRRKSLNIAVQMALASLIAANATSALADYAVGVDSAAAAAVYVGSGSAQAAAAAATDYESNSTNWPDSGVPASVNPTATASSYVDPISSTANETAANDSLVNSTSHSGGADAYAVTDSDNASTYDSINNPLMDYRTDATQEADIPTTLSGTSVTAITDAQASVAASAGYDGLNNAAAVAAGSAAALATSRIANFNIESTDGSAISLNSDAYSYATATAYAYANDADDRFVSAAAAAAAASATASVNDNTLINTGNISSTDIGIDLEAWSAADAYASATATGDGELDSATQSSVSASYAESLILDNTITNNGSIEATDSGIRLNAWSDWDDDQQSNYNSAKTEIDGNIISNAGSIVVTNAIWGAGIDVRAVTGFYNAPINADAYVTNNEITNTGTIAVAGRTFSSVGSDSAGFGADGIRLRAYGEEMDLASDAVVAGNYIANTGRIYAEDDGIELSAVHNVETESLVAQNTIENTYGGRIVARDAGISIFSNGNVSGNIIRNSGLIVSDTGMSLDGATLTKSNRDDFIGVNDIGTAILVRSYDDNHVYNNALELNAPAYLAGTILLDKNADVEVALNSGVSHSVRWAIQRDPGYNGPYSSATFGQQDQNFDYQWSGSDVTRAVLGGPLPWFVNEGVAEDINGQRNDVYATIDPSAFAASANVLADLSGMVSTMAKTGMSRTADKDGFWLSGHGARMNYDGDNRATADQDTRLTGGALGYTHNFDAVRVGVMAGYSDAELQVGSFYNDLYSHSYDNDTKGGFAGIYVNGDIGWLNVNAGISGGRLSHDDKRFVNDNLKWWGVSYATADYDSTWYSPEITLAVPFQPADGLTVTPSVHLQYTKQNIDGYTEKGSDSNAHVSGRDIAVSEAKIGLDITKTIGMASLTGRVGYLNRNSHGDDSVKVTMIGDTHEVSFFYQDINAAYVGAALNLELGERVDFNLSGNYLTGGDIDSSGNVTGMLRIKY